MDYWKFEDLIINKKLYMSSLETMSDGHEGLMPQVFIDKATEYIRRTEGEDAARGFENITKSTSRLKKETFISSSTSKTFMEAHHLIPISNQILFWDKYNLNIDCIENLVSLCPTCHRAIHYAIEKEKLKIIESLYNKRISSFKKIGLNITLDELIKLYV